MASRLLGIAIAAILSLCMAPVSVVVVAAVCDGAGLPLAFARIADVAVLAATLVLICWYVPRLIGRILKAVQRRLSAPVYGFVEWGGAGALLVGGACFMIVLIFGRTQPDGWSFGLAYPLSGAAFVVCGAAGFREGRRR